MICRDKDDDNIMGSSVLVKVNCIVTGDKDLKVLKNFNGINIVSLKYFWSLEKVFLNRRFKN